jgi:preprotein translocase subunit SecG
MFPAAARRAIADSGAGLAVLRTLHRICRVYSTVGIVVPVFGLATASSLGVLGDTWLIVSIALTAIAAGVLVLLVLPRQGGILAAATGTPATAPITERAHAMSARLAMYTGVFNVLWVAVTVLMILRPGSTTGA